MSRGVRVFSRFEIVWHWSQAVLFLAMLLTGFEIRGAYALFGHGTAAAAHVASALALIVVWLFAVFWHVTTGEWRQYVPAPRAIRPMLAFYSRGIFRGETHPFRPTRWRKHNPLQLVVYLVFSAVISPLIWATGLLYLAFALLGNVPGVPLGAVALIHVAAAYVVLVFLIGHLYMITTGETVFHHTRTMLTGFDPYRTPEASQDTDTRPPH